MYRSLADMRQSLDRYLEMDGDRVKGIRGDSLPPGAIDAFARNSVFHPNPTVRTLLRKALRECGALQGIQSCRLPEIAPGPTPRIAFRLGGHCYDLARLILRAAKSARESSGISPEALVFEQGWAGQSPWEFSALLAAAALREDWRAPIYLRCCLPPLAGDLLDGGRDADTLLSRLRTALDANFRNLTIRMTPGAALHERSRQEALQLLSSASDAGYSVLLRFWDEGRPFTSAPGEDLARALEDMCAEHPPQLLGLGPKDLALPDAALGSWQSACHAAGLAMSGGSPGERPAHAQLKEWRPEFHWAERIVLHEEFPAEQRRRLLDWLHRGPFSGDEAMRVNLLRSYEYQALGHFEFELWNLDGMPDFRSSLQSELKELFHP